MTPVVSTHRGRQVVLGRRHVSPPVLGPQRRLARMLMESLPPPPGEVDWAKAAFQQAPGGDLGMMGNDQLGDCTKAAIGHAIQVWTANTGTMVTPPDSAIIKAYETVDGYIPGNPATDNGGVETETLGAWARGLDGLGKLDAWIPINFANLDHVRKAIYHFGLVYVGAALPMTTDGQDVWTVDDGAGPAAEAGSRGGHAYIIPTYKRDRFGAITWGGDVDQSIDWALDYTDEAYALLATQFWCRGGKSPLGQTATELLSALQAVT